MTPAGVSRSSFRDPAGFVFFEDGQAYRQINRSYQQEYEALFSSGLYEELTADGLLIEHAEEDLSKQRTGEAFAIIRPALIPLISYPYEWCFSQYKDAALATLVIERKAIARGMSLKDASAFNIQFRRGRPVLIDTLSFERFEEGQPWIAYRQFCRHFLAPLALMANQDIRLSLLTRIYLNGIPLDLASKMAGWSTRLNPGLLMHLHMHARSNERLQGAEHAASIRPISKTAMLGLIDSLEGTVNALHWKPEGTEWVEYYADTNYSAVAMAEKSRLVSEFVDLVEPFPSSCWDLGANTGEFSEIVAAKGVPTVAWDVDPAAVEKNYLKVKGAGTELILPLAQDLTNPSPSLGCSSQERESFIERGPADLILALALIHHLAIGNNVPAARIADFFAQIGKWAIVEFVPKSDSQVQRLLVSRKDVFDRYTQSEFEQAFGERFSLVRRDPIKDTERTLYLFKRKLG